MRPLEGMKVLDFTQVHAGSLTTRLLADFGAEIIKIERPYVGDLARYWPPIANGESAYYAFLNRGKNSIGLNGSKPEGKEIIEKLLKEVDVICENFKYGSMERMGLSYEDVKKINPEIIYASLNGFGQTGPLKENVGLDLQLQAMSGYMDRTGFPDGAPTKAAAVIGDQIAGTYMANAILLAAIHKKKTGKGQQIDISILESLFATLEGAPVTYSLTGTVPERVGNEYPSCSPYDNFETNDGYVAVGVATDRQWQTFCKAMKLDHLAEKEEYKVNEIRGQQYHIGLKDELEALTKTMSKFEIEEILRGVGLPCGAVRTVAEAMSSDQVNAREMLIDVNDKAMGNVKMPGIGIKMSETPGAVTHGAPLLGEYTDYYLSHLGYSSQAIEELESKKIIQRSNG
ncbi:CoA transferase [Chakrabartyella piscis]|uniref:CaiB/BaiF CoA transferase family protein n=1 Tax=Chakrabartyella piscis TaxID=2918914 RepID=UPI002958874A|nr:CoA transferase [Chakrabartyella piscis]